jgi:hypothetical protein
MSFFLLDTISSVLISNTSPILMEIVVMFPSWECLPPARDPMVILDAALVAHSAARLYVGGCIPDLTMGQLSWPRWVTF